MSEYVKVGQNYFGVSSNDKSNFSHVDNIQGAPLTFTKRGFKSDDQDAHALVWRRKHSRSVVEPIRKKRVALPLS
jgi:hypothetical protein